MYTGKGGKKYFDVKRRFPCEKRKIYRKTDTACRKRGEKIIFSVELCKQKVEGWRGLFYCKNAEYMVNYS